MRPAFGALVKHRIRAAGVLVDEDANALLLALEAVASSGTEVQVDVAQLIANGQA